MKLAPTNKTIGCDTSLETYCISNTTKARMIKLYKQAYLTQTKKLILILFKAYDVGFDFVFPSNNNNHNHQQYAALHFGIGPSC